MMAPQVLTDAVQVHLHKVPEQLVPAAVVHQCSTDLVTQDKHAAIGTLRN